MSKIPILNLYYLLSYSWELLDEAHAIPVEREPFQSLPDLFARVLRAGVAQLLRRGLDRGYVAEAADFPAPRGKIDVAGTVKRNLRRRGAVACHIDELRPDVLHNRILKATLMRLARCDDLDTALRPDIVALCHRLHEIPAVPLTPAVFDRVVIHRNNRAYRLLIEVCRLLALAGLTESADGRSVFRDFTGDERTMARLFERFVRRFYRREQGIFNLGPRGVKWLDTTGEMDAMSRLPGMQTDVTLMNPGRTIIIDAKYYAECLQTHHARETARSAHLYQLFAYLKNTEPPHGDPGCLEGILLYPVVSRPVDLRYTIHGHPVRVATVDLNEPWQNIRRRLLGLLVTE